MKENKILMEIAIGKSVAKKLPSYIENNKEIKNTVAEEVLFQ